MVRPSRFSWPLPEAPKIFLTRPSTTARYRRCRRISPGTRRRSPSRGACRIGVLYSRPARDRQSCGGRIFASMAFSSSAAGFPRRKPAAHVTMQCVARLHCLSLRATPLPHDRRYLGAIGYPATKLQVLPRRETDSARPPPCAHSARRPFPNLAVSTKNRTCENPRRTILVTCLYDFIAVRCGGSARSKQLGPDAFAHVLARLRRRGQPSSTWLRTADRTIFARVQWSG